MRKRIIKLSAMITLLLIVTIAYICPSNKNNPPTEPAPIAVPTTYLNNIEYNDFTLNKNIENIIIKYMDQYYKTLLTLEKQNMDYLFGNDTEKEINNKAMELLLYSRTKQLHDMTLESAKYDIIITNVQITDNETTVTFKENNTVKFRFMNNISKAYGISNEITINNDFKITKFRKHQDFYVMFTNEVNDTNSLESLLTKYKQNIDQINELSIKNQTEYLNNENVPNKECDHQYDREKAVTYAKEYINKRNNQWSSYDEWGNCQNYASQIIFEGGIPMDHFGNIEQQWKHYDSDPNESSTKEGRSYSWTTVGYFYDYAKNNTGYGLCSIIDANPYYGDKGDIVQVGYNNKWNHTVVVIDTIKNNDKVIDLLINSNTTDLENYPLSSYVYPEQRLIKIVGWNEK